MKVRFSNLIVLVTIVDFGKACDTAAKTKQTPASYSFDTHKSAVMSSNGPVVAKSAKPHPLAGKCTAGSGEPTKLVVRYSKTGGFDRKFEECDTEAYLVKLEGYKTHTNVVRTKASCVTDIQNGKPVLRKALNFQIIVANGDSSYYGIGKPLAPDTYTGQPDSEYNIGLIRIPQEVLFHIFAIPGCEKDPVRQSWVQEHAPGLSKDENYDYEFAIQSSYKQDPEPHPFAVPCTEHGQPLKVVVKYSKEHDFTRKFEKCDTEAYLVKLEDFETQTNIVRTKASCLADRKIGNKRKLRKANTLQVNLGGFGYRIETEPIVHELYGRSTDRPYDIGLIRLTTFVSFGGSNRPGREKDHLTAWWVKKRATDLSKEK